MYDHHDKIFTGTQSSSTTSSNLLCEEMRDNVGCYDGKMLTKKPIYVNWMELTLCKQLCITNGTTFAGIRDDACFCLKETDLDVMTKLISVNCSTRCPGNFLQYCGSGSNINVYSIENSSLAQSCDQLYNFGIFYNNTYLLNISGLLEYTHCGFADETICEAGWYGYQGACFRFNFTAESYQDAAQVCINSNGLLVSPTMFSIKFLNILNYASKFKTFNYYWTSLINQFGNHKYLHGDGQRFADVALLEENGTFGHWVYLTWLNETNGLLATDHVLSSSPFVCQTSSRYIGCVDADSFVTTMAITNVSNSGMSATFCIQYCVGQNAEYAAITNKIECKCYNDVINFTLSSDPCHLCPGYTSQACGSLKSISLYNISFYMDIYESCDELLAYGITEPSWYYIKPHKASKSQRVKCFETEESFMPISVLPMLDSSPHMSNHDAIKSRLKWPYEEEDSWKPSTLNGSPYLTFTYPFDVIITGLVTQGNPLGKNNEWTRQFVFKYWDDILEQEVTYSHEGNPVNFKGNTDRSSLKYNIFSNPIITREFKINPTDWNNWPALRVDILGQPLSSYNYSQSVVKCYFVTDEIRSNTSSPSASSLDECKTSCLQSGYPLCSFYIDNSTNCYCWNTLPSTYGSSENQTCNTNNRLLVYKTYEKLCADPPTEYKATRNYTMPVPGFYTYKSTLTDTCIDGRFLDKNVTKSYTCLQDNKWSEDILICEAFCNQLQIPSNAKANSSEDYVQTVIAVTCDHYFVTAQNHTTQYVTCNETGMWDSTLKHCDVYLCDETPSLLHASKYLKDSNTTEYICDPYYSFSNGSQSRISYMRWN
ncbi:unnamed protein product [Mytilus coruscus]|uniref:WSC domain-containing protein n=1 Tax=Mytilus coruscus TaxID=42192 RepID=A0A6J8E8T8_MYTCO|nr:unnamed protein product [Mytilus coruscus]